MFGLIPTLSMYPEELKMPIQCLNDSALAHALSSSFAIPMHWLLLACSTTVYNKNIEVVTFQMESKGTKRLLKNQFAQILQLPSEGTFEVPSCDQVL